MRDGIYHVKFSSSSAQFGEGLAVFKDGKVNGGDQGYLFIGSYTVNNSNVTAQLKVKRWNPASKSIIGNLTEFDLNLTGSFSNGTFSVKGSSPAVPQAQISINGRHLADPA